MFFDEYPKEKLSQIWSEFAKTKRDYTPEERWKEIIDCKYMEPFMADKREVVGLGIELDETGKGLLDWALC